MENIRESDDDAKSAQEETLNPSAIANPRASLFQDFDYKTFTKHFSPESISIKNSFENKYNLEDQLVREQPEIRSNSEEESLHSNLINLDIENAPFDQFSLEHSNCIIAVTGQSFEALWKLRNKYLQTEKAELKLYYETFRKILQNGYIFARMSPEHKTILVECLRDEKFTVLMCGDGANDCGALRAADVGVSVSIEEASIAAHFTSNRPDISCLIKLLREGKASLATSIQTFKYMIMYSLIQFIAVSILVVLNSYLTDSQFLISDFFITFPLAFLIGRTGAYEKLTAQKPNSALISVPIITSIIMQTLIQFIAQYGIYMLLAYQKGFNNECVTEDDTAYPCLANTVTIFNFFFLFFMRQFNVIDLNVLNS